MALKEREYEVDDAAKAMIEEANDYITTLQAENEVLKHKVSDSKEIETALCQEIKTLKDTISILRKETKEKQSIYEKEIDKRDTTILQLKERLKLPQRRLFFIFTTVIICSVPIAVGMNYYHNKQLTVRIQAAQESPKTRRNVGSIKKLNFERAYWQYKRKKRDVTLKITIILSDLLEIKL